MGYVDPWSMMGWGNPYGKGKGKGKKGKGKKVDPSLKVWIGGLTEEVTWKDLKTLFDTAGKTTWVEAFEGKGKGTGFVSYNTAEEVASAVASFNGAALGSTVLQVDYWVKQEAAA